MLSVGPESLSTGEKLPRMPNSAGKDEFNDEDNNKNTESNQQQQQQQQDDDEEEGGFTSTLI